MIFRNIRLKKSESPELDREVALALLGVPAAILGTILGFSRLFGWTFWICILVFATCLLLARQRLALIAVVFAFAAIRLMWGFLIYGKPALLLAGIACVAAVIILGRVASR